MNEELHRRALAVPTPAGRLYVVAGPVIADERAEQLSVDRQGALWLHEATGAHPPHLIGRALLTVYRPGSWWVLAGSHGDLPPGVRLQALTRDGEPARRLAVAGPGWLACLPPYPNGAVTITWTSVDGTVWQEKRLPDLAELESRDLTLYTPLDETPRRSGGVA